MIKRSLLDGIQPFLKIHSSAYQHLFLLFLAGNNMLFLDNRINNAKESTKHSIAIPFFFQSYPIRPFFRRHAFSFKAINNKQSCKQQKMQITEHDECLIIEKNRLSNSTANSEDSASPGRQSVEFSPTNPYFCELQDSRNELLTNKIEQPEITQKTTAKAISWLVSTCWTNDLSDETLHLAVLLFYCYKANRIIPKARLELILLSAVYVSSKRSEVAKFKTSDILSLSTKNYTSEQLIETESDILSLLDFNLEFETTLHEFLWKKDFSQDQINRILFLTELAMFESSDIYFEQELFDDIVNLVVKEGPVTNQISSYLKLAKAKETKVLQNKHASKFDVEELLNKLFDLLD